MRRLVFLSLLLLAAPLLATTPPPYRRVLVPLLGPNTPGAGGSLWTTELWATNQTGQTVAITYLPCVISAGPLGGLCEESIQLPPQRSTRIEPIAAAAPGVLLLVPNALFQNVAFNLHVRDLSRNALSWGAEIPVVRDSEFLFGSIGLTNIPFGTGWRQTLRIYALFDQQQTVELRMKLYAVEAAGDRLLREQVITLDRPPSPPPNRLPSPLAQTTVTSLFEGSAPGVDRVRVSIEQVPDPLALQAPVAMWAFVSATNNATQEVTTSTPH